MERLYVVEHQEIYKDYHLVVVFNNAFRCGYVGLKVGHKLEDKHYDDVDFEVHGGLTYSSIANEKWAKEGYRWYFGFDCAHLYDGVDIESMKKYGANEISVMCWSHLDGEIRTQEYVLIELKNLVNQIEEKGEIKWQSQRT